MVSRLLGGLAATALMLAPAGVLAQAAPAPAAETVAATGASALRGSNDTLIAGVFFSILILLIVFQDDLFGDDGDLDGPTIPASP